MTKDEIIRELVEMIIMQEKELDKLRIRTKMIESYLEVYEDYIKGREA